MQDRHGRLFTFGIDEHDQMRGHAAFSHTDDGPALIALSSRAVEVLGGSDPDVDHRVLAALHNVRTIRRA